MVRDLVDADIGAHGGQGPAAPSVEIRRKLCLGFRGWGLGCGAASGQTLHADDRSASLIRDRNHLETYRRHMPRGLWWPGGGAQFLMSEVPL